MDNTDALKNKLINGSVEKHFFRYVSQNIMGVVGLTAYYFADTYFISQAAGADGLTALNLILPFFYFIYAVGDMFGIGAATRFTVERARGNATAELCFGNALTYMAIFGAILAVIGWFWAEQLLAFCGADKSIVALGGNYLRIVLVFSGGFLLALIVLPFVRNDGSPRLAMIATLVSSLYNIVFDYILIFPMGLGMVGAALATVTAPIVGGIVAIIHLRSPHNTLRVKPNLSLTRAFDAVKLGTSAFVGEISSCVVMVLYNSLFLLYTGNEGVAAYGVIANLATMVAAVFSGLLQGAQPLMSFYHGCRIFIKRQRVLRLSLITSLVLATLIMVFLDVFRHYIIAIFNRDGDRLLAEYASLGILCYFPGFLFAGINVIGAGFLSATEVAGWAGLISILRGFVMIFVTALTLPKFLGITGIWLSFPVAELLTMLVVIYALKDSGAK